MLIGIYSLRIGPNGKLAWVINLSINNPHHAELGFILHFFIINLVSLIFNCVAIKIYSKYR